jgi:ATP-dependent helicase/nuclease subunit B
MLHDPILISTSARFWDEAVAVLTKNERLAAAMRRDGECDWSSLQVIVPTAAHIPLFKAAFAKTRSSAFIPPRVNTLGAWLAMLPPERSSVPQSNGQRVMDLYAELRQHAWLKKLFSARRNTDLLPLAQTLLSLCDELSQSLLPLLKSDPDSVKTRWETAVAQLQQANQPHLLSDEAQLVWSIWQSQLDNADPCSLRFGNLMRLADAASGPLVWIAPTEPDGFDKAFLERYGQTQFIQPLLLDWRAESVAPIYRYAWAELAVGETNADAHALGREAAQMFSEIAVYGAKSLEDEARHGAQTIIEWLSAGKIHIGVIAQDRVVARRIRALLERAGIYVADETGWKLSTTRAAAAIMAWFDLVAARAETLALMNFLKSPFLCPDQAEKPAYVMAVEVLLRRANVLGGWEEVKDALAQHTAAHEWICRMAGFADQFEGRKRRTMRQWLALTGQALDELEMRSALLHDPAGMQIIDMLSTLSMECDEGDQVFSFSEWRAFFGMQLESTSFISRITDRRVVMLPLNGAHLRPFDAVLVVGADADHLPSHPTETLFFANAVRRELGLDTHEHRQRQQLRDFAELLSINPCAVLSWQAFKNNEPNPASPWIRRLELVLEFAGLPRLSQHAINLPIRQLKQMLPSMPAPIAPELLPQKLSASGYNSFVACPYQFFATRMLGLTGMDELSDMPEKRDYGDWLHQILATFHDTMRDKKMDGDAEREALLRKISAQVFSRAFGKNGAVLGYYARWQKAIPAYLDWDRKREAEGWRFSAGEQWLERTLTWMGGQVTLHGRVDRIDENSEGERAVLDYKTKDVQSLRDRLKKVEDHQLAFYGLLNSTPPTAAQYVALEPRNSKTGAADAQHYTDWQEALEGQIISSMQAIQQGAPLQATGIELICQYCDVRGMCRKGCW